MRKKITILGSTGSIGLTTLNIISKKKNQFKVTLLAAKNNYKEICKQINKYKPIYFVIANPTIFKKVKKKFKNKKTKILDNYKKIKIKGKSDVTISAIPGTEGLLPTLSIIKSTKKLLLANKESVICGWELIKNESFKYKVDIVPIDSEHYSILKLIKDYKIDQIKKIYLTASGGPFLNYKPQQFKKIRPKDALKHPKWKMGKKITIDSSTLMNKILELIEAQKLFNIPSKKLDILIHPNSLVHAIVELKNGLTKFIYHETSMTIPVANALFDGNLNIEDFYKTNIKNKKVIENLTFSKVSANTFPVIKLKERVNEHPSTSIIINATNEILVDQFLKKKIPFLAISKIIMSILNSVYYKKYAIKNPNNISQIIKTDNWARQKTLEIIRSKYE